jgi:diguanylate cyclase (GGDEF)-like protein
MPWPSDPTVVPAVVDATLIGHPATRFGTSETMPDRTPTRATRIGLVLAGMLAIGAIVGVSALIINLQRQAMVNAFQTATDNLGSGMSQQMAKLLGSADQVLRRMQASVSSGPQSTVEDVAAVMGLSSTFDQAVAARTNLSAVDALFLVDASGRLANVSRSFPAPVADLSGEEFFRHFRDSDDHSAFVSQPTRAPTGGGWITTLTRRVADSHGRFAGLVGAQISLSDLEAFFQIAVPPRRNIYLMRRDGVVLVSFPRREGLIGTKLPLQSDWFQIVAQGGGAWQGVSDFDQTRVLASIRPLPDLPIVIEASVAYADTLLFRYRQSLWVVLDCLFSVFCVVVLLRMFVRQYRRLELSERQLATKIAELDGAHEQLHATLGNLSHGVAFYDNHGKLVVHNRRYCELYQLPPDAVRSGMSLKEIALLRQAAGTFSKQTIEQYLAFIDAIVRNGQPNNAIIELANGTTIAGHIEPIPDRGYVVALEDITERRKAEAQIAFLARHDALTGLANRALFHERLDHALALAERGRGFALLYLDLDGFKGVNDAHGHAVGDALLRAVAGRLQAAMRETDTVARLGGDEFAILQIGVSDIAEVTVAARRIVQSIDEPFDLDGRHVSIGTSIGIAMAPGDGVHPAQLMKNADLALYRSKHDGRGAWRFFEPAMDEVARTRRELEKDLRRTLKLGELGVHYQPLVDSRDRNLIGFEALVRWHHPTRGMVAPTEFISVAEEVGLIGEIGTWVLQTACAEATSWPPHLRVAVNLSTRQFRGGSLVTTVADALEISGLNPSRLELEITESVPLQQDQATLSTLQELHKLGTRIALDDFGTGYSSLSYLRGFPFDKIKIDRSFVSDLPHSEEAVAIVRGILGLAANLHLNVTAEGVETEAQCEFLAAAGCTEIQGYLISMPVPAREVPALIKSLSGQTEMANPLLIGSRP